MVRSLAYRTFQLSGAPYGRPLLRRAERRGTAARRWARLLWRRTDEPRPSRTRKDPEEEGRRAGHHIPDGAPSRREIELNQLIVLCLEPK